MSFELPRADKPEDVGLSSERLQRLTDTLKSDIDKGIVPGAVALIARRGKIAYETALGYRDREAGTAMEVDTIFRVASMTKPLTSLSAMMLAEEGRLLIADAVAHLHSRIFRAEGRDRFRQRLGKDPHHRAVPAANDRAGPAAPYVRLHLCAPDGAAAETGLRGRQSRR